MIKRHLIFWLAIFLIGCSSALPTPTVAPATEIPSLPATSTSVPEFVTRVQHAEYQLGATDALRTVQLVDGKFEQGTPGGTDYLSVVVSQFVASGDLNNDGRNEVAALIAENYGGTGVFTFLTVYADVNGSLEYLTSLYVDDRPALNALSIDDREIFLDVTTHKNADPLCCPTLRNTRQYRLGFNNQLDLLEYTTFTPDNRPRTISIESPVDGAEVNSVVQVTGSVAIAPFENNLVFRIYDVGGVELAAGAVAVSADELGGPGTFSENIVLGNILSGAVVRIEIQDVSAEDSSLFAMDSVELVVK